MDACFTDTGYVYEGAFSEDFFLSQIWSVPLLLYLIEAIEADTIGGDRDLIYLTALFVNIQQRN